MSSVYDFFRGVKDGMGSFSSNLTIIVNTVLLSIIYFVGVGLTSLFARVAGKRFLETGLSRKAKTYWTDLNLRKRPIEEYYRQF